MKIKIYRKISGDFTFNVIVSGLVVVIGFWALVNFVITTPAADIIKHRKKYDNQTKYIKGKVIKLGSMGGVNLNAVLVKTRMGKIWLLSPKDYPNIGSKLFSETVVYGSGKTFWSRFKPALKKSNPTAWETYARRKFLKLKLGDYEYSASQKRARTIKIKYPVLYEMTRLAMPF